MRTYWVEYTYDYECVDMDGTIFQDSDVDARRMQCRKKDILEELKKDIEAEEQIKVKNIKITDCYPTTDYEV